jgi:hypothetical protein
MYFILLPLSYAVDALAYLWLIVALVFYSVLNSIQIAASNYLYKDLTSKLQTTFTNPTVKVPVYDTAILSNMGSNNTIDNS